MKWGIIVQVNILRKLGEQHEHQSGLQMGIWPYKNRGRAWITVERMGDGLPLFAWTRYINTKGPRQALQKAFTGLKNYCKARHDTQETQDL